MPTAQKGDTRTSENYRSALSLAKLYVSSENYRFPCKKQSNNWRRLIPNTLAKSASFDLLHFIRCESDKSRCMVAILFELSKASDTNNTAFLLAKASVLGSPQYLLKWLRSYLEGRTLLVNCNKYFLRKIPSRIWGSSGSVLGPILLIIFINNMTQYISVGYKTIFADN